MAGANQMVVGGLASAARTVNRLLPDSIFGQGETAKVQKDINDLEQAVTYHPQTPAGQQIGNAVSGLVQPIANTVGSVAGAVFGDENVPAVMDGLATLGFRGPSSVLKAAASRVVPGLAEAASSLSDARAIDQANTAGGAGTLGLRSGSPLAQFIEKQSARLWGGGTLRDAARASNGQLGLTARDIIDWS